MTVMAILVAIRIPLSVKAQSTVAQNCHCCVHNLFPPQHILINIP